MSLEEDTDNAEIELRDLVTQTLEDNGILPKIRAQLRAGLYLALENDLHTEYQNTYNEALKSKLKKPDIRIIFCLVKEFLEYFELNYTSSIFDKETLLGTSYDYESREKLIQELDIGIDTLHNAPLLLEIINIARSSFNISARDFKFNSTINVEVNKNCTYDISAHDKLSQSEKDYSSSDSITSEVSQHVIGVKTIPKNNTREESKSNHSKIESKSNHSGIESNSQNGNNEDSYRFDKDKTEEEIPTQQSEIIRKKMNAAKLDDKFEADDTYEGTSSIAEDSVTKEIDKSTRISSTISNSPKHLLDLTLDESSKSPRLSFSPDQEKRKHDKTDKLKPMSGLSSLSDLPPVQLNKSRNSDTVLLPSLYSKDFREKSSLKELDKLLDVNFDSLDNYEEDFMSSGSVDNEDAEMNNILQNMKIKKADMSEKSTYTGKTEKNINIVSNGNESKSTKQESATTSISEEYDINSNVDDLLKSSNNT